MNINKFERGKAVQKVRDNSLTRCCQLW